MKVQSIEYFACARSIFSKLDIWTPRYLGAKYLILCMYKKYLLKAGCMNPLNIQMQSIEYFSKLDSIEYLGIYVQSIEYFAHARSILSKLD